MIAATLHVLLHMLFGWSDTHTATCKFNKVKQESSFSILKFVWNTYKTYFMLAYWINYETLGGLP